MALNKARKLFVFAFSFVLIVCTFVVLSSADEFPSGENDGSLYPLQPSVAYRFNNSLLTEDMISMIDYISGRSSLYFFTTGNSSISSYFQVYDLARSRFIPTTYYALAMDYNSQDGGVYFTCYGSSYPNGVIGDYTSQIDTYYASNVVLIWFGNVFDNCVDYELYDIYTECSEVFSFDNYYAGQGYNDGYNSGYNDGYDIGYNDGVLNGDVSLTVGDNSVYINPSQLTSRFYIKWYSVNEVLNREGWFIIFGDSESVFYVYSDTGEITDATVLSTLYTRERGWLSGYGAIINLPFDVLRPSRYATISIPRDAIIYTDRDNLVGAISLFDYNVLDERFISPLGEVYRQLGYDDGLEIGNDRGYNRGYGEGYTVGYNVGVFDGSSNSNPQTFNKLGAFLVNSVGAFLDTELFFGFNIGHILAIIVGASLFFLMIKLLR